MQGSKTLPISHAAARRAEAARTARPARPGAGQPAARTLELDPLEPRVLLNADTLAVQLATMPNDTQAHDVLVQLIDESVAVGHQTQTVQRVQVLDQAGGAVLAMGDLSEIRTVAIASTNAADVITLDAKSFGANALPKLKVEGDGMTAVVVDASGPVAWQVNGDGSGVASGAGVDLSFTGVASVTGGGSDTLRGPAAASTWQINGPGAGTLEAGAGPIIGFAGFSHLDGAGQDNFVVQKGGSVSGGLGEEGGFGALTYAGGQYASVQSVATAPGAGTVTVDGAVLSYTGIRALSLPDPADTTLSIAGYDGVLQDAPATGFLQLSSTESGTTTFAAPSHSLTINMGDGSGEDSDILTLKNIDSRFTGALTINGGGGETVNLNTSLATNGGAVTIGVDTITVAANVVLDTRASGAASGAIAFTGTAITLDKGSELRADALGAGGSTGDVTLLATDTRLRPTGLPFDFSQKVVSLDAEGATILGGNISLTASDTDGTPTGAVATALGFLGDLVNELSTIPGLPQKVFPGIDASVIIRGADAHVSVDNSTITASGSVTLDSTTDVTSNVVAIANVEDGSKTQTSFAAGYGEATSTVDVMVTGNSSINAAGDVTLNAMGTLLSYVTATAQSNVQGAVNNDANAISIAIGYLDLTDQAIVGNGASITAGGSVNVLATGSTEVFPTANTITYVGGKAGVTAALSIDDATVNALVDGSIHAGSLNSTSTSTMEQDTFDGSSANGVTLSTGTFHVPNHGFVTGEEVTYDPGTGNTAIAGLDPGTRYYALVQDANDFQLSTIPPIALSPTGTNPASKQTLTETTTQQFILDPVDPNANTLYLPGSGFTTGDTVTYNSNGNPAIGGLTSNKSYTVSVDGDDLQFTDPTTGTLAQLSAGGSGLQTFTDGTDVQTVALATVDTNANAIDEQGHGFTQGEPVTYVSMAPNGADPIGGLTSGGSYTVNVLSPNSFQLVDATTGQTATLADPGDASLQSLTFISKVDNFNPSTAVDGTTATISLPGNTLKDGQSVIYNVDPAGTTVQTVYGQITQTFALGAVDPVAHSITIGNNGFANGDTVSYSANGHTAITGLQDNGTYTVQTIDGNSFQLLDGQGNVVPLSQGGATGTQYFTDGGNTVELTLASLNPANSAITLAGNGFTEGETVGFAPGRTATRSPA